MQVLELNAYDDLLRVFLAQVFIALSLKVSHNRNLLSAAVVN